MKESARFAMIEAAFRECGEQEQVARMQAMILIEVAGKEYERAIAPFRKEYEQAVRIAENCRVEQETHARRRLTGRLTDLNYIRRV